MDWYCRRTWQRNGGKMWYCKQALSARNTSRSLPIQSYTMKQCDIPLVRQPRTSATCRSQKQMPRHHKLQKDLRTEIVSMFSIVCVNILYASSLCCERSVTCEGLWRPFSDFAIAGGARTSCISGSQGQHCSALLSAIDWCSCVKESIQGRP